VSSQPPDIANTAQPPRRKQPPGGRHAGAVPFATNVLANLAYWRERTRNLDDQGMRELYRERQNLYQAVLFGLQVPEARVTVTEVALQVLPFVRRRMAWPEWVPIMDRLLADCPEDDPRLRLELLIGLGRLHDLGLEMAPAISAFRQAEAIARHLHDVDALARVGYFLGWAYMNQREYGVAQEYALAALELSQGAGRVEPWLIAEANRLLGRIAERRGEFEEAEARLRQAVTLRREIAKPVELARSLLDLGNLLRQAGNFEEAVACLEEAGQLLAPTTDELDKIAIRLDLGVLYFAQGKWAAAERAFRLADTPWLRRSGYFDRQAGLANNLGNALLKQERWAEAEAYLRQAVKLYKQLGDEVELANAIGSLGEALAGQDKAADALALFDEVIVTLQRYPSDVKARRLLVFYEGEKAKLVEPAS
jgi:tetratricopeptide (TPR) repeat protein